MKRDYYFLFTIKPSRIYLERFNLKKLGKKFHLKIIYIKNPKKIKYCNLISKNLKLKKAIKFSSLAKKSKKIYLSVIANFESDKLEIYNHCRAYENIKLVDFYMYNYSYTQTSKHFYEVLKQNLVNNIFTNINFIIFSILKIILLYFKNIILKKKKDIKLDYLFYSGSYIKKKINFENIRFNYNIPSFDSLKLTSLKKITLPKKKFILFQDEMLINHIDLKLLKEKAPEDFDYYNKLNSFFSFLEKKLNFDVVIALHPRSNLKKSKKLFNNRKCKINLTAELVKKSEFVCMHASTSSISFPILLKKKILILNSNNIMKNFNYRFRFEIIKKYINLRNINLDNYNNYENDLRLFINTKIKHKQYINYRNKFLGPLNSKNLNFSDICLSKLI